MKKKLIILLFFFYCSISYALIDDFKNNFNGISIFYENAHPTVRKSLFNGLNKLGVSYTINPQEESQVNDVALCLDNVHLLRRGIALKNNGIIKKLIVGPHILARTNMENHILSDPAIDYYLTPSEWNFIANVQDEPQLEKTMRIWPAGVDSEYWKPTQKFKKRSKKVLIYWKTEPQDFCNKVKHMISKYGWEPLVIRYGNYTTEKYKNLLNQVQFAVFLSRSESQGLALAECWSMNIPTLVWDSQHPLYTLNRKYSPITSCPYLTPQTGLRWQELNELEKILQDIYSYLPRFNPREWILNNMTDEISVTLLLKIINE